MLLAWWWILSTRSRFLLEKLRVDQLVRKILRILKNLDVNNCDRKILPLDHKVNEFKPSLHLHTHFFKDHFNIILTSITRRPNNFVSQVVSLCTAYENCVKFTESSKYLKRFCNSRVLSRTTLTLWKFTLCIRSSSKDYLRIQSVPEREHYTSPLRRSNG
jgi:hypothetical protein